MCIERGEKVDFKSREVNCLKECALALKMFLLCFLHTLSFVYEINQNIASYLYGKQIKSYLGNKLYS